MTINYGNKMEDLKFKKLAAALANKKVYLTGDYTAPNVTEDSTEYGFVEKSKTILCFSVLIDDKEIMSVNYRSDAEAIITGFKEMHPSIECVTVRTTTSKKQWAQVQGSTIAVQVEGLEGSTFSIGQYMRNQLDYSPLKNIDLVMRTKLRNNVEGLQLEFKVIWVCDSIKRKEEIEEAMVQLPLADMGIIQKIVEGRMKLKKFNIDVEDVEINCHFDAKTESRSECTPDIIKQVRDARKGLE